MGAKTALDDTTQKDVSKRSRTVSFSGRVLILTVLVALGSILYSRTQLPDGQAGKIQEIDPRIRASALTSINAQSGVTVTEKSAISGASSAVEISGTLMIAGLGSDVKIYDVSDIASAVELASVSMGAEVAEITIEGDMVYALDVDDNVKAIDVSDENSPNVIDDMDLSLTRIQDSVSAGGRVYFASQRNLGSKGGVLAAEVVTGTLSEIGLFGETSLNANSLARYDDLIVGTFRGKSDTGELKIISFEDDAEFPAVLGSHITAGRAGKVDVISDTAYISIYSKKDETPYIEALDLSGVSEIISTGVITAPVHPDLKMTVFAGLAASGNRVVSAEIMQVPYQEDPDSMRHFLRVIEFPTLGSPVVLAAIEVEDQIEDVAFVGDTIATSSRVSGIRLYSIEP